MHCSSAFFTGRKKERSGQFFECGQQRADRQKNDFLADKINPSELSEQALEKYNNLVNYRRDKYYEYKKERLEIIKEYQGKMHEGLKLTNPLESEYLGYFKNHIRELMK